MKKNKLKIPLTAVVFAYELAIFSKRINDLEERLDKLEGKKCKKK